MAISETQLETWAKQGPTSQFTSTYETLRGYLDDSGSPYYSESFQIFLQGSYKNDTNVYGDSDVDIVVRLDSIFYPDLYFLNEDERGRYHAQRSAATYSLADFKKSVTDWLVRKYGSDVTPGKKAIYLKGNGARRDADILVCAKLRRYHSFPAIGEPRFVDGICFFLPDGTRIENYPEKHSENCTAKHKDTSGWFKPTVRIFKNLRNALVRDGAISDGLAPSYFIEGLIYNVPGAQFGGTEQANFRDITNWLLSADRSKFTCANGQFYLHGNTPVTWPTADCDAFLKAVKSYWDAS